MSAEIKRVEIVVGGLVQGVGFRWFVMRNAQQLGLTGYTQNLYTGEVHTVAEGPKHMLEDFFQRLRVGPDRSDVRSINVRWSEPKYEFNRFEIKH